MDKMIVRGGRKLSGVVKIDGAKNAVLPILAATLLASDGISVINNVPVLSDVYIMNDLLRLLGAKVEFNEELNQVTVDATGTLECTAPYEVVSQMRASIVVLGPLLARLSEAHVAMPGGCAIGQRPIDLHLKGFKALGAKVTQKAGSISAVAPEGLKGRKIYLDFPSVGATENILMASVLAKGTTIIENVAREPEIVDLANLLKKMGANIYGVGTQRIRVIGVEKLKAAQYAVVQDRIEAGTFMVAGAVTGGDIKIQDAIAEHNKPLLSKLSEMGVDVIIEEDGVRIKGPETLLPASFKTLPHPGFPTDLQSQLTVAQVAASGTSHVTETVFENRFQHLEELAIMGADVQINGNTAFINGGKPLDGANVEATDLRAAAALIIAGLIAEGDTVVHNLQFLDRGYYKFHEKLAALGADIKREEVKK
ncbi:MAG: UDP-N-acetylglucosamine 1-carboxyvinyltransferase [Lactobacillales bacterium]|jgi:UDP-N-acetylglucosamine 1-carboxyvinyltransferase|nr:UDP-N-acetylglucosamine 1-carboxyvinyltransferase [Lactobacillales bacterium]